MYICMEMRKVIPATEQERDYSAGRWLQAAHFYGG